MKKKLLALARKAGKFCWDVFCGFVIAAVMYKFSRAQFQRAMREAAARDYFKKWGDY